MKHRQNRCSCGNLLKNNEKYCYLCKKDMVKPSVLIKNELLYVLIENLYKKVKYEK